MNQNFHSSDTVGVASLRSVSELAGAFGDAPATLDQHLVHLITTEANELAAHGVRKATPEALLRHCTCRFGQEVHLHHVEAALASSRLHPSALKVFS